MTDVASLMWTSVKAILPVFILMGLGAWFVHKGILDAKAAGALSWLSKWLYSPSLVFVRLGQGFSQELFAEVGILMPMGVVILSINFILSLLLVPVAKPTQAFRKWFVYSMTFSNITALPLVFISAVCTGGKIRRPANEIETLSLSGDDQFYESAECIETGELYLVIYIAIPYVLLFMTAVLIKSTGKSPAVERAKDVASEVSDEESTAEVNALEEGSRQTHAENDGVVRPQATSASDRMDSDIVELALPAPAPPSSGQAAPHVARETSVEAPSADEVVLSAKETKKDDAKKPPQPADSEEDTPEAAPSCGRKWAGIMYEVVMQPAVLSQIFGLIVGLNPKLQAFVFNTDSAAAPIVSVMRTLAPGLVSVVILALALLVGSKMTKTKYSELLGGDEERMGISRRTLFVFVFGRMLFIPAVSFSLLYLAIDLFPKNQMLLMILFFEVFVPTANMCAICAPPEQGQIISLGMINQYLVGILSMTMWCFLALTLSTEAVSM
ncbi:Hypothetical Protein FCC1311_014602 [Hondaea fermentalgiana]|uniref:Uncharacterized protein n=1 Tax=Hondaea fermentalgiana TaxID=2315210 RepID=A0A2R5G9Q1_9STRA|nr:Hypothetical Protein FCC1311_014602 [Hondaea fermentalgiana]|eukprot:GBG25243.1 Hypothetical Protein FCC1311_014602 [Hondaea fermentalgiana]